MASLRLTSLPPGAGSLYAVYSGTDTFAGSTSPVIPQSIVAPPAPCTGKYTTSIVGTPGSPVIKGTTGNDFIYAVDEAPPGSAAARATTAWSSVTGTT